MLRERSAPMNWFNLVPTLSLALDPVLTQLDRLLDDDTLFQTVQADLACRFLRTLRAGRPSTPVGVIWRMRVVKHLNGWSDDATARWVSASLVWRQFCRVYVASVPEDTTLLRGATLIQPATRHHLLDHVVIRARSLKVTRGRKLRIEGTVVATPSHHPTDSTLLDHGVRVLGRTLAQARAILPQTPAVARAAWRDRTRRAKRQMQRIMEAADRMRPAYQRLLAMMQATVPHAQHVGAILNAQATPPGQQRAAALAHMMPLVCQVISQMTRRVLQGEVVPAAEQVVSLFAPQTAISRKGKPGRPTAFGRVIWLDAVEGGIVSQYTVLDGNP